MLLWSQILICSFRRNVNKIQRCLSTLVEDSKDYILLCCLQMDPAEYLVELERFASFAPIEFQMYQVNMHLKRFPEALKCLLEAGDEHFQACLDLAANQGLLPLLLELVDEHDDGDTKRQKVLHASGEWLLKENMLEDAGAAFLAANEVQKAHQAYK